MCKYLDSRSRSASIQRYALKSFVGSDGPFHRIRTTEGKSQQIYSLPHLATLVTTHCWKASAKVIIYRETAKALQSLFYYFNRSRLIPDVQDQHAVSPAHHLLYMLYPMVD